MNLLYNAFMSLHLYHHSNSPSTCSYVYACNMSLSCCIVDNIILYWIYYCYCCNSAAPAVHVVISCIIFCLSICLRLSTNTKSKFFLFSIYCFCLLHCIAIKGIPMTALWSFHYVTLHFIILHFITLRLWWHYVAQPIHSSNIFWRLSSPNTYRNSFIETEGRIFIKGL